jgi:phosphoesterase RecJ-like protein
MATNLYAAILTDTGRFHYANTTPNCMRAAAHLLELGASTVEVTEKVYFSLKPQVVKLTGRVVGDMQFELDGRLCLLTVDQKTLAEAHVDNGDIEGLVNYTLYARGVELGALFTELSAGKTKVSFRSQKDLDVAAIAAHFGGGGHVNASGCIVDMPLREARETIIRYIEDRLNGSV